MNKKKAKKIFMHFFSFNFTKNSISHFFFASQERKNPFASIPIFPQKKIYSDFFSFFPENPSKPPKKKEKKKRSAKESKKKTKKK